jgi:hypothetical protein
MTSGALPRVLPAAEQIGPGQGSQVTHIVVGQQPKKRCLICEELRPQVSDTYQGGKVVRLHAACDALWRRERAQ